MSKQSNEEWVRHIEESTAQGLNADTMCIPTFPEKYELFLVNTKKKDDILGLMCMRMDREPFFTLGDGWMSVLLNATYDGDDALGKIVREAKERLKDRLKPSEDVENAMRIHVIEQRDNYEAHSILEMLTLGHRKKTVIQQLEDGKMSPIEIARFVPYPLSGVLAAQKELAIQSKE